MSSITSALDQRVATISATLRAKLASLPSDDDIPTLTEREAIFKNRHVLSAHVSSLSSLQARIQKLTTRLNLQHNVPWRDALISLRDQRRQQIDALPHDAEAKRRALLFELSIIEFGPGEQEAMSSTLFDDIVAAGFPAENGLVFRQRGGLFDVEARVSEFERERREHVVELERALADAEQLLGGHS